MEGNITDLMIKLGEIDSKIIKIVSERNFEMSFKKSINELVEIQNVDRDLKKKFKEKLDILDKLVNLKLRQYINNQGVVISIEEEIERVKNLLETSKNRLQNVKKTIQILEMDNCK